MVRLHRTSEAVCWQAKLMWPVSVSMSGNCPHHPQCRNHNRKCTRLTSLLSLFLSPHPIHPAHNPHSPSYVDLFPFPLGHLKNSSLSIKIISNVTTSSNPSLTPPRRVQNTLPCSLSILYLYLAERRIRA